MVMQFSNSLFKFNLFLSKKSVTRNHTEHEEFACAGEISGAIFLLRLFAQLAARENEDMNFLLEVFLGSFDFDTESDEPKYDLQFPIVEICKL